MLIYTGMQRTASLISNDYTSQLNSSKKNYMKEILQILHEAKKTLKQKKKVAVEKQIYDCYIITRIVFSRICISVLFT